MDPGTDKCGMAVLSRDGEVLYQGIVQTDELAEAVQRLREKFHITAVGIGDRTGAQRVAGILSATYPDIELKRVAEDMTSLLARQRYWQDHPPRGLQRLIPVGLRFPPRPVDDYAAVILAERLTGAQDPQSQRLIIEGGDD